MTASLTVSACTPLYCPRADWLAELFRSLQDQRCDGLELVLRDDTPGPQVREEVREVLDGWRASFARFDYQHNGMTLGMVENWNEVVRASRGELVVNVHQDDVLSAGMIAAMLAEFRLADDVVACAVGATYIDTRGREIVRRPRMDRSLIFRHQPRYELGFHDMVALNLRNGQAFGEPSAVMFRRAAFDAVGGYDASFEHAADVDLNLRLAATGPVVYLRRPYLQRRIHETNLTRRHVRSGATARDRVRLFDRYALTSGLSLRELARVRTTVTTRFIRDALRSFLLGNWRDGIASLRSLQPFARNHPAHYAAHLLELARGMNLDER